VLGHIASWEEVCLEPLRRYADGGPFKVEATEDYLSLNEPLAARKQDIPLDAILDELGAIRQALVATASRLSAEHGSRGCSSPGVMRDRRQRCSTNCVSTNWNTCMPSSNGA
jgi:hypothetical protein